MGDEHTWLGCSGRRSVANVNRLAGALAHEKIVACDSTSLKAEIMLAGCEGLVEVAGVIHTYYDKLARERDNIRRECKVPDCYLSEVVSAGSGI